jgi:heme/copper-type cytochrome/quinol oxidase subunit 3
MDIVNALPILRIRKPRQNFDQLRLIFKSQLLRDKLKMLRQSSKAPHELIHQAEGHLNAISQESNTTKQWSQYELAYEEYITVAPQEDLLGIFLDLRTSLNVLNLAGQDLWSTQRLDQLEREVRRKDPNATIREEIASLARADYGCRLQHARNSELKWKLQRVVLSVGIFFSVLVIALLIVFQMKEVPPVSPLQMLLVGCFGACAALLSSSVGLLQLEVSFAALREEAAKMFFRAAVGALAAVVIALFLRLRVVDFPSLHSGPVDTTPLAPAALYIFAFLTGTAVNYLFSPRGKGSPRGAEASQKRSSQKSELAFPQIDAGVRSRDFSTKGAQDEIRLSLTQNCCAADIPDGESGNRSNATKLKEQGNQPTETTIQRSRDREILL